MTDTGYTPELLLQMQKAGLPKPSDVTDEQWAEASRLMPVSVKDTLRSKLKNVGQGDKSAFGVLFPIIMEKALDILDDPNEPGRTKVSLIQWIGDQFAGKAEQAIQHTGDFAVEFRQYAEAMREVGQATFPKQLDALDASIDDFLDDKVGTDFKVGKRGEES